MKKENKKLLEWQEIISADESAFNEEIGLMEEREAIFRGKKEIDEILSGDKTTSTAHVRNIVSEIIESQINSSIPQPKVSALRREDEALARLIEDMLRNKLDKLPFASINDQMERTVPVQGGCGLQYDWDNNKGSHTTIGEGVIFYRHPKQIIPQDGVTSSIEDMDHITLKIPQTLGYIKRKYDIDLKDAGEDDPGLRSGDGKTKSCNNMVDQYVVYSRNERGGLDIFSWVQDTVLEDIEDYQARHLRRCNKCGQPEPACETDVLLPTLDGTYPGDGESDIIRKSAGKGKCPYCGGSYKDTSEDFQEILVSFQLPNGETVNVGEKIPFYKPNKYPVLLQRNVSTFGKLLGESDVDKIRSQQNTTNRLEAKIMAQLLNAGSYVTLPANVSIKKDSDEGKVIHITSPADKNMIDVIDMTPNIQPALAMLDQAYQEAQQLIGITDSFLGRKDSTATSGKAKEFSASQAAGRLESKRIMKNEMYARLFEIIFKFELAYADEPRPVMGTDIKGNHLDETWNRWDFLKKDAAGAWYWNDEFLFSVDSTAPLAQNREAMWAETRSHFSEGAFGDPKNIKTQITYWQLMAELHYPGAAKIKEILSAEQTQQAEMAKAEAEAQKEATLLAKAAVPDVDPMSGLQALEPMPALPGEPIDGGGVEL
ncbi:MAG: hypothetical protein RR394_05105 [Oscillospiraceae bacterium]